MGYLISSSNTGKKGGGYLFTPLYKSEDERKKREEELKKEYEKDVARRQYQDNLQAQQQAEAEKPKPKIWQREYYEPSTTVRGRDFARELLGIDTKTQKTRSVAADTLKDVAQTTVQAPFRAAATITQSVVNPEKAFQAKTIGQKLLLGSQPQYSVQQRVKGGTELLEKVGIPKAAAVPLAVAGTASALAMDLFIAGGGTKGAFNRLANTVAKSADEKVAISALRRLKVPEDTYGSVVPQLIKESDPNKVKAIFNTAVAKSKGIVEKATGFTKTIVGEEPKLNLEFKSGRSNAQQFDAKVGKSILTLNSKASRGTIIEEVAHALDRQNPNLRSTVQDEVSKLFPSETRGNEAFAKSLRKVAEDPQLASSNPRLNDIVSRVTSDLESRQDLPSIVQKALSKTTSKVEQPLQTAVAKNPLLKVANPIISAAQPETIVGKATTEASPTKGFTTSKYYKGDAKSRYGRKINVQAINTVDDVQQLNADISSQYTKLFQDVKGGVKPNEVTLKQAEALGWTPEKIVAIPEGALLNDAQTAAVAQVKADLVLELAEKTRTYQITGDDAVRKEMGELFNKILSVDVISKRSETELGRAIQIKKNAPIPREFEDEALFDALQRSGIANVQDLKGALTAVGKLDDAVKKSRLVNFIEQAINTPRSLMSTADLSAPLRQGVLYVTKPKQFVPAFTKMFKYFSNEKAFQELQDNLVSRPTAELMSKAKLALSDLGDKVTNREEAIMSNWVEKIPLLGRLGRASNRAYTGFLNKLRADVFDDMVKNAEKAGIQLLDDAGKSTQELTDIATVINTATGRGNLTLTGTKSTGVAQGVLEKASPLLNAAFFSPRLMASRLQTLNPAYYIKLTPFARKEALKSLVGFAGLATGVLSLAKLNGAEVSSNTTSADFGKIKVGDTRYDILGGFQQPIRAASQIIQGKIASSTTGKEIILGEGYKPITRFDVAQRFFEMKESPLASLATALMKGETTIGEDIDVKSEIAKRFIPMIWQDAYDLYKEGGFGNIAKVAPAIFGISSQTYGNMREPLSRLTGSSELNKNVVDEFNRLQKTGNAPAVNKISDNSRVIKFKGQVDKEKYNNFLKDFGDTYKTLTERIIKSSEYDRADDEQKKKVLDKTKSQSLDIILKKYGYKSTK